MLLRAGIPAVRALDMVRDLLAAHLRPQLVKRAKNDRTRQPMSAALGAAGLATPVAARMMVVGERSGDMGDMLGADRALPRRRGGALHRVVHHAPSSRS